VAAACLAAAGCGSRPAPNVLLISVDTLRQDALGCYGNRDVRTPAIDALARDGMLFRRALSHAPSTLPSHAAMLYSQLPWSLGVLRNGDTLPARTDSLPGVLRTRGYRTAAFTSLAVLDASFGLAQGFDHYDDDVAADPDRPYRFADEVNARLLPWLDAHQAQPFFAFVHYSDPHEPYAPRDAPADVEIVLNGRALGSACFLRRERPRLDVELRPGRNTLLFRALRPQRGPRARRYEVRGLAVSEPGVRATPADAGAAPEFGDSLGYALENTTGRSLATRVAFEGRANLGRSELREEYLREVEWVDQAVGELVTWLRQRGLYERSLLLLVADHGEGLGDHGIMGHESQVYLSQILVPMIVVDHRRRGVELDATVTLLDVAPTILGRLGAPRPESWRGQDLAARAEQAAGRDVLSAAFFGRDPLTPTHRKLSVLRPPHHLIVSLPAEREELYDIDADPAERRNLLHEPEPPPAGIALRAPARALAAEAEARLGERRAPQLQEEQLEKLRALGYLGGSEEP
jgi:arylsulfatase A-like enzyme